MKKYIVAIALITFVSVSARVEEINSQAQFRTAVAQGISVVKFYRPSCGYCQAAAKPFEEISQQFPQVHFLAINTDDFESLADQYGVQGLPTFAYFKNGRLEGKTHSGFEGLNKLKSDIEEHVKAIR